MAKARCNYEKKKSFELVFVSSNVFLTITFRDFYHTKLVGKSYFVAFTIKAGWKCEQKKSFELVFVCRKMSFLRSHSEIFSMQTIVWKS